MYAGKLCRCHDPQLAKYGINNEQQSAGAGTRAKGIRIRVDEPAGWRPAPVHHLPAQQADAVFFDARQLRQG
jgi:hypothetical protein